MKTIFTLLSAIALMGLAMPATSMAATKKKTDTTAPDSTKTDEKKTDDKKKENKGYPVIGTLVSITSTELVIKGGKDKPDRKYTINKDTNITKDKKPATVSDAKVGQEVTGYALKSGEKAAPGDVLGSLNLSAREKKDDKKADDKKTDTSTTTTTTKKKKS